MNAVRKRALALAQELLNETAEDCTPTDHWTDDDWYIFLYASTTSEQRIEIMRFLTEPEKVKPFGQEALFVAAKLHNPFTMDEGARRIITDSKAKTGVFEPIWLTILRRIAPRTSGQQRSN